MAKARLEETDRRTTKDVVENGERLETPVTFNSLTSGLSIQWGLVPSGHVLHNTLPSAVRLEVLVLPLFSFWGDWPEEA